MGFLFDPLRGLVAPALWWWFAGVGAGGFAVEVWWSVSEVDVCGAGSAVVLVVAWVVWAFGWVGEVGLFWGWPVGAGVEDGGWCFGGGVFGFGGGCDGEVCE